MSSLLFLCFCGLGFGVYKYIAEHSRVGLWMARVFALGFCYAAYEEYGLLPAIALSLLVAALALYLLGRFEMIEWGMKAGVACALVGAAVGGTHSYLELTRNPAPSMNEKYQWIQATGHITGEFLREEYGGETALLLTSRDINRDSLEHFRTGFRAGCASAVTLLEKRVDLNAPAEEDGVPGFPYKYLYEQIKHSINNEDSRLVISFVPVPFPVFEAFVPEEASKLPEDFPKWFFVSNGSDRMADLVANEIVLAFVAGKPGGRLREVGEKSKETPREIFDERYILIDSGNLDAMQSQHPTLFP